MRLRIKGERSGRFFVVGKGVVIGGGGCGRLKVVVWLGGGIWLVARGVFQ